MHFWGLWLVRVHNYNYIINYINYKVSDGIFACSERASKIRIEHLEMESMLCNTGVVRAKFGVSFNRFW